ncbi:AsmA-like C-terminal region-containing protein [Acetobacter sp.]|uniref:AsmA-like C-terminal region-containing protein n=1 Tax=Acetobacter sp. TaxID=440 RepID=UPI0039EC1E5C
MAVIDGSGQDEADRSTVEKPQHQSFGRRLLKIAAWGTTALVGVPLVATGGVLLAMMAGPVNVTPLLRLALPVKIVGGAPGQPPRGRLDIGHASLRWTGLRDGLGSPVLLELADITVLDSSNQVADRIASGAIALDGPALLQGRIAPTNLQIKGASVALRRDAQGDVDLDLPGAPSGKKGGFPDIDVRHLRRLIVTQTHITLTDDQQHSVWTVDPLETDLTPVKVARKRGLAGTLAVTARDGDVTLHLAAHGAVAPDNTLLWHVDLDPLTPAKLAGLVPGLAAVRAPVALSGDVTLGASDGLKYVMPRDGVMKISLGEGEIDAAGSTLYPASGSTTLHMAFGPSHGKIRPAHLDVQALNVQLRHPPVAPDTSAPAPSLTGSGTFDWPDLSHAKVMTGNVDLALSTLPFTDLAQYWPALAAKGARRWVTRNITDGTLENTHVHLKIGPNAKDGSPDVIGIGGGLDGRGLDVHWLRPIAPLHGLDAHLDFTSLSTFTITFDHGWQPTTRTLSSVGTKGSGRLAVQPGSMIINGLDQRDQTGTVTVGLNGDLRDHVALLSEPRLHVLSRHPLPFTHPQGGGLVRFTLTLPLIAKVTTDDMTLDGHAHLTRVHLTGVAMNRNVDNGTVDADVTMHGMNLTGKGLFSGIPANVRGNILFDRAKPGQAVDHIVTNLHLTPENVAAAGIPVAEYMSGLGELKVDYAAIKGQSDKLALDLDLAQAAVHIPLWSKPVGRSTTVHADLLLNGKDVVAATDIRAVGPELNVNGNARFVQGKPPQLVIPAFQVARSTGSAILTMPRRTTQPVEVKVNAQTLDLSPLVEGPPNKPASTTQAAPTTKLHVPEAASGRVKGPPGRPWLIDVTADRLYYQHDRVLGGVKAFIDHNGRRVDRMKLSMVSPTIASAEIVPVAGGRRMTVDVSNFGALLSQLAITEMLAGGHAVFEGHFDDTQETSPFRGHLKLSPFTIQHAPGALLVARSLSIYGWLDAKDPTSFDVTRFEMPVTFADGVMHIHDGRAGNEALGATLEGPVYLDRGTLDLSGTIVPVFAINEIPGKIPALGKLFSPEKGGGLLAVKFKLDGKIDKPDFSVSPLTIFLPGLLRNMF